MQIKLHKTRDLLTPDLKRRIKSARDPRKHLEAMGLVVVSMTQRAFTQSSLRPASWPPLRPRTIAAKAKAGKSNKPLIGEGLLARSPRISAVTNRIVTVGSDRPYASHHQLGTKHIPARPYFPFDARGRPTNLARRRILQAVRQSFKFKR